MSKAPSSFKRVKSLNLYSVKEDGERESQQITLWLDTRGDASFCVYLPQYVSQALAVDERVVTTTAERIKPAYELLCQKYSEWKRTADAKPVIILHVKYLGRNAEGLEIEEDAFFIDTEREDKDRVCAVGLAYTLAFEVNGHLHYREMKWVDGGNGEKDRDRQIEKVGMRYVHEPSGIVLPYTPELHARIDAICETLDKASQTLKNIIDSKERAAELLMRLGNKLLSQNADV